MVRAPARRPGRARRAARRRRLRRADRGGLSPRCRTDRTPPTIASGCWRRSASTSVDELFADIPEALRASAPRPARARARARAGGPAAGAGRRATGPTSRRSSAPASTATGRPPAVDQLLLRGEWYTAYTPYQPEISQGTLQSIYEYESLIAELIGPRRRLGLALRRRGGDGRGRADDLPGDAPRAGPRLARRSIPTTAQTLADLLRRRARARRDPARRRRRPAAGTTDLAALERLLADPDRPVAGVIAGQPNFFGLLEPMAEIGRLAHAAGALFVAVVEPVSLAVLAPPGAYGADIAAGEGQPLGIAPQYGGPYLGLLASTDALVRQIPGRLVGMTTDLDGKRAYVMTLRAREQDIRRDKAASNICTNQALLALAASHLPRDARAARPARRRRAGRGPGRRARGGARRGRRRRGSTRARTSTSSRSAVPRRARRSIAGSSSAASSPASSSPTPSPTTRPSPTRSSSARPRSRRATRSRGSPPPSTTSSPADRRSASRPAPAPSAPRRASRRERPDERRRRAPPADPVRARRGRAAAAARSRTRPRTPSTGSRRGAPARDAAGPARAQRARGRPPLRQPLAAQLRDRHRASTRSARAR